MLLAPPVLLLLRGLAPDAQSHMVASFRHIPCARAHSFSFRLQRGGTKHDVRLDCGVLMLIERFVGPAECARSDVVTRRSSRVACFVFAWL